MKIYYDTYLRSVVILHGYSKEYDGYEFSTCIDTIGM